MLNYREDNRKKGFAKVLDFARKHIITIIVVVAVIAGLIGTIVVMTGEHKRKEIEKQGDYIYKPAHTIFLPISPAKSFNPLSSNGEDIHEINQLLFSSLFTLDNSLNIKPELTESYETDADKGAVKIKLRTDARFSDGSDMTSEDIKYTVEKIQEIGESSPYYIYANRIEEVETLGKSLFNIRFKEKDDAALDNLIFPIVSSKKYGEKENFPTSSGRYVCKKYDKDESIVLEPNKYYFGKKGGKEIDLKILENRNLEIGLMTMDSITAAVSTGQNVVKDVENRDLASEKMVSNRLEYMGFNCGKGVFKNRNIRKACAYAINQKKIVQDDYADSATVAETIYYPGFLGSDKKAEPVMDLKKSADLLKKEGYKTRDKEGYYVDEEGNRLKAILLTDDGNASRRESADTIVEQLKKAGIEVELEAVSRGSYIKKLKAGEFDIYLAAMQIDKQYRLVDMFSSGNYGEFNDAITLERVKGLEKCIGEEELIKQFKKVKESLDKNMPYLPICYENDYLISTKTLVSKSNPVFFNPYRGIEGWKWEIREPRENDQNKKK